MIKSKKKIVKSESLNHSAIYMMTAVFTTGITFITLPIFTRYLSPSDYGVMALFMVFGQISCGLLSMGMSSATYRFYFNYSESVNDFKILNSTNILFNLIVFLLFGLVLYFSSSWFSLMLFDGRLENSIIIISFISGCINYFCSYFFQILMAQTKSKIFGLITILGTLIRVLFIYYFIKIHSLKFMALIFSTIISQVIALLLLIISTKEFFVFQFSSKTLKKSTIYSYPQIPITLVGLMYSSFDKFFLNKYSGIVSIGYYTIGARFAHIIKIIMDSIGKVYAPYFLKRANENSQKSKIDLIERFFEMSFMFMLFGLSIIYFSEEMIKLLTTKEYYPSMYVVPVYIFYYLFSTPGMLAGAQRMHTEKLYYEMPSIILSLTINILLNILLIPKYGAVGAAIATAIAALFGNALSIYFGLKIFPLPLKINKLVSSYLILIAFTLLVYPIMMVNIHFAIKILLKIIMLFAFLIVGIKMKYISRERLNHIISQFNFKSLKFT